MEVICFFIKTILPTTSLKNSQYTLFLTRYMCTMYNNAQIQNPRNLVPFKFSSFHVQHMHLRNLIIKFCQFFNPAGV